MGKVAVAAHERRTYSSGTIEFRAAGSKGEKPMICGYAALFNVRSQPLGWYQDWVEVIAPGAFDDVLGDDVRCLFNHDASRILARTKAGTLKLSVDEKGLWYEAELVDTSTARDLMADMEAGNITQSSFAFDVANGGRSVVYYDKADEHGIEAEVTITKLKRLYDVSPVTYPAYEETEVMQRDLEAARAARCGAGDWEASAALRNGLRGKNIL